MVVGSRAMAGPTSPSPVNNLGNIVFSRILRSALIVRVTDVLSGYRALSRMLVKSLPLASSHFEIEVELTIKTSQRSYRIREVPYSGPPSAEGIRSHLSVVRDGPEISWAILLLFRDYRPLAFFGGPASPGWSWRDRLLGFGAAEGSCSCRSMRWRCCWRSPGCCRSLSGPS